MVPADAIGDAGRDVRCKKCAHVWFQKSEKGSLEDLISRIQSSDIADDDISFADLKNLTKPKATRGDSEDGFLKRLMLAIGNKNPFKSMQKDNFLKYFAGCMVAIAVLSVIACVGVVNRSSLVGAYPEMSAFFKWTGFSVSAYAQVNPENALILEKVEIVKLDGHTKIIGNLINLTSNDVLLPRIVVTYVGMGGESLRADSYKLNAGLIRKEDNVKFSLPVADTPPEKTQSVNLTFR